MEVTSSTPEEWFVLSTIQPGFHSKLPASTDHAVAIFLIITGMMSLLGNGTVLWVYFRKRKNLRRQELLTINLAVCDFGFSLIGAPFGIISSLCHAWVFGEAGCLWYGIQGFVFGIGSLHTTCLISLDRCLMICCLRYGQWIERRHVSLAIGLVWLYTLLWASLPAFGFGSYGPEPYGTSCTINWWRIRSCLSDRIYIFLILMLCFGFPTVVIIASYVTILLTVYRSNRTLASIPFSSVSRVSSVDLRLTKIAAVVCASFLVAWVPYAAGSLYSALGQGADHEPGSWGRLQAEPSGAACGARPPDVPELRGALLNWTLAGSGGDAPYNSPAAENWGNVSNLVASSTPDPGPPAAAATAPTALGSGQSGGAETEDPRLAVPFMLSMLSLIPVLLAKSHCMFNPFIYQIMNPEFRQDACDILSCGGCRRGGGRERNPGDGSIGLSSWHRWRRRSNSMSMVEMERQQRGEAAVS